MTYETRPDKLTRELAELIEPSCEYDLQLVDNVHPAEWANPTPASRYHLVVIGAGTAGLVSAAAAAGLGAKVALIERRMMGGDCLNHGCVPSKALISAARVWSAAATGSQRFGAPRVDTTGDFGSAMKRMRRLRAQISHHDSADRFSELGIDVFIGEGRLVAPDEAEVGDAQLKFRRAIIATGARPMVLPIPGLADSGYLTNETVFTLTELPKRLAVIGAGPIGCELAQTFARFGSRVTLFDIAPQVLIREDVDAAAIVQRTLIEDGIDLRLGVEIKQVARQRDLTSVLFEKEGAPESLSFNQLLLAVGRSPNVDGLGLDDAGVEFSEKGVEVDDRLETSNRRVYAVGDVASKYKFTHVADALARIAIQNALFFGRKKASDLVVPWCTYTDPEVAHVGLSEAEAKERGYDVETLTVPLQDVDRAILEDAGEGFLRMQIEKGKDRILGATLVAPRAGDLLGELCLAVTHRIGLSKISTTIHPYPTQAEIVKKAGDAWMRGRLTPTVQRALRLFLKIFR
jgi:pyruvate/2-oxoglutarate dehydrogenase complex dihydrolipoamide dehydrogenase (E3) component